MNLVRYILLASVFLTLAAGSVRAQGLSEYTDDFATDKARSDCYFSSTFWPSDINCPPARPYLFYYGAGDARGLAFMDYREELAQLVYSFVVSPAPAGTLVRGTLRLWADLVRPSVSRGGTSGYPGPVGQEHMLRPARRHPRRHRQPSVHSRRNGGDGAHHRQR
jgi:hypothetical protein